MTPIRPIENPETPVIRRHDYWGVVLDAREPRALARFYCEILGWSVAVEEDAWVALRAPDGVAYLAVQLCEDYAAPVWPPVSGTQHMMMHLDFEVSDLEYAVSTALHHGARSTGEGRSDLAVMLDPEGHPFCLYVATASD